MRNILFEHNDWLLAAAPLPRPICRRLLSITIALQLSGAPPPDALSRLLLARYVAGEVSLSQILPLIG